MKTAIVYYSKHHQNTKKLIDEIAKNHDITLIDAIADKDAELLEYDLIGFASGIYYSKYHKSVLKFAKEKLPMKKKVFFLHTYGVYKEGYTKAIEAAVKEREAEIVGEYGSLGFNTFGPFKLIGGIAKGHPNKEELLAAEEFFKTLCEK